MKKLSPSRRLDLANFFHVLQSHQIICILDRLEHDAPGLTTLLPFLSTLHYKCNLKFDALPESEKTALLVKVDLLFELMK